MQYTFLATLSALSFYLFYQLINTQYLPAFHTLYVLIIIIYNSTHSQNNPRFSSYHPPLISQENTHEKNSRVCQKCMRAKPDRYYHCRRCKNCIFQMDHHCEWLNSCVGMFNYKMYLHILFNLFILSLRQNIIMFFGGESWLSPGKIVRFFFSGFTIWQVSMMLKGALEFMKENQTLIESYKGVKGEEKKLRQKLEQVYGSSFSMNWLFPGYSISKELNIWEEVRATSSRAHIQEHAFADEYIYGTDDDEEVYQNKNQ